MTETLTENQQRLEDAMETWIQSRFSGLPEATCEIRWDSGLCSNPATHIIKAHDFHKHEYIHSRICPPCLGKAITLGFMKGGTAMCPCGVKPIIVEVRPI